ncbi:hypothetical protein [Psychrobacter sp. PAMC 21119]|uniref:hypothetical protein n=1 Tax=Psychrobacter sp. PAMC 21119 TaxID=1112209 RepID=UPI0002884DB1|nr:hypothetical protein [Psychrobacter sp. PAMC 21119]
MTNLTSTYYFKDYSEKDMEAIKQELSEADISLSPVKEKEVQDTDLKPLNWQEGDIAMSPTHFYMIYNDTEKGIAVRVSNKVINVSDTYHGFPDKEDAKNWIKNTHCPLIQERLDHCAAEHGLSIDQRWLSKKTSCILEIVMIDDGSVYTNIYNENKQGSVVKKMNYPAIWMDSYSKNSCLLMLDGETAVDCLIRCGIGSKNHEQG